MFPAMAKIGTVIMRDQAYPVIFLWMEYLRNEQLLMAIGKKIRTMTDILKSKAILTLAEAAEYMGLKKSYLYRLTHEKRIRHYKPNNKKIYFRVEDIIAWLTSNPILTDEELAEQAQSYCLTSNNKGGRHGN